MSVEISYVNKEREKSTAKLNYYCSLATINSFNLVLAYLHVLIDATRVVSPTF